MTSTRSNSRILLEVRLVSKTNEAFTFFEPMSKKLSTLQEGQESRGDWRTSQIGSDVIISLATSLATSLGIGTTYTGPESTGAGNING